MKKDARSFVRRIRNGIGLLMVALMVCFVMAGCSSNESEDIKETLVGSADESTPVISADASDAETTASDEIPEESSEEGVDVATEFAPFYDGVFKMEYTLHQDYNLEAQARKTAYTVIVEVDGDYNCLRVNGYKRDFVLAHDGEYSYLITDQAQYRWKEEEPHITGFETPWSHSHLELIMRHVEWYDGISQATYDKYEEVPFMMYWDMDTQYIYQLGVDSTMYQVYELVSHSFSPDDYDKYEDLSLREVTTRDFTEIPAPLEKLLGLK